METSKTSDYQRTVQLRFLQAKKRSKSPRQAYYEDCMALTLRNISMARSFNLYQIPLHPANQHRGPGQTSLV